MAIPQKSAESSFAVSVPDPADNAFHEGLSGGPAGGWQQTAGIFSALATMLSLTAPEADRQSRVNLIRQLDELETTVRNGTAEDGGRLKAELARLEAELRARRGITGSPGLEGGGAAAPGWERAPGVPMASRFYQRAMPPVSSRVMAEWIVSNPWVRRNNSIILPGMFRNRLL